MDSNQKKSDFLGMPFGTASGRLRKLLLFDLISRFSLNLCYRCGKEILSSDDLSIDHKEAWLGVDVKLFWDLGNIAFSHLNCNCTSQRKAQKTGFVPHGTHSGYSHHRCKCPECNRAHNEYQAGRRAQGRR